MNKLKFLFKTHIIYILKWIIWFLKYKKFYFIKKSYKQLKNFKIYKKYFLGVIRTKKKDPKFTSQKTWLTSSFKKKNGKIYRKKAYWNVKYEPSTWKYKFANEGGQLFRIRRELKWDKQNPDMRFKRLINRLFDKRLNSKDYSKKLDNWKPKPYNEYDIARIVDNAMKEGKKFDMFDIENMVENKFDVFISVDNGDLQKLSEQQWKSCILPTHYAWHWSEDYRLGFGTITSLYRGFKSRQFYGGKGHYKTYNHKNNTKTLQLRFRDAEDLDYRDWYLDYRQKGVKVSLLQNIWIMFQVYKIKIFWFVFSTITLFPLHYFLWFFSMCLIFIFLGPRYK